MAGGAWTVECAHELSALVEMPTGKGAISIDLSAVERMDTFGAWLLEKLARRWREAGATGGLTGVPPRFRGLLDELGTVNRTPLPPPRRGGIVGALDSLGRSTVVFVAELNDLAGTLGMITVAFVRALMRPRASRLISVVHHLDRVGWQATGIILLITFLVGCIIAQQGLYNFRRFGAEDYVVSLVGILVLREIGVLLVAVMIAGRSGSAYTAELGSMKMREEIDALRTMGIDPAEVLLLPHPEVAASARARAIETKKTFPAALTQIVVADVSMSLDNVLAVAGTARDHQFSLIVGLAVSVALMGVAATVIARVLHRVPWISYVGLVLIAYVAVTMIIDGGFDVLEAFRPHAA